jgi:hypothetical protein
MIREWFVCAVAVSLVISLGSACSPSGPAEEILAEIPLDSLEEVISKTGVTVDSAVTTDGRGSLRVSASEPMTVRIAELEDLSVDNARLIYRARLRTADLSGKTYLEMWCEFPGRGAYFSRALDSPVTGTNDWLSQETPFVLQKGQIASKVKLNLVIDGPGTVWLDEIVLTKAAL